MVTLSLVNSTKEANILLAEPGKLEHLKVADFGFSTRIGLKENNSIKIKAGTLGYMAPEKLSVKPV